MEDPEVDWKMEKYNPSSDYSEEEGKGNFKWIMERGLSLGKRVVITGFVVSSAPVVLPPIMVVSAVGFACSVPFGLIFAGYACTQKLMNKLLPIPASPPMLEYEEMFDAGGEIGGVGGKGDRVEYCVDMEEEEKEQMEDLREGVEQRIELVKNENVMPLEGDEALMDIKRDDEERLAAEGSLKESGYQEDDDDNQEQDLERADEEIDVKIEGEGGMLNEESIYEERRGEELFPEGCVYDSVEQDHETAAVEQNHETAAEAIELGTGEEDMGGEESIKEEYKDKDSLMEDIYEFPVQDYERKGEVMDFETGEGNMGKIESVKEDSKGVEQLTEEDYDDFSGQHNERAVEVIELKTEGEGDMGKEESTKDVEESPEHDHERAVEVVDAKLKGAGDYEMEGALREEGKDEKLKPEVKRVGLLIGGKKLSDDRIENSVDIAVVARGARDEGGKNQLMVDDEDDDIRKGSVGLLEKIRDEGGAGDAAKKNKNKKKKRKKSKGTAEKPRIEAREEVKIAGIVKESENPVDYSRNEQVEAHVHLPDEDGKTGAKIDSANLENGVACGVTVAEKLQEELKEAVGSDRVGKDGSTAHGVEQAVEMEVIHTENRSAVIGDHIVARELTVDYRTLIHSEHATENSPNVLDEKRNLSDGCEVLLQPHEIRKNAGSDLFQDHVPLQEEATTAYPNVHTTGISGENRLVYQNLPEVQDMCQGKGATRFIMNVDMDLVEIPVTASRPEAMDGDDSSKVESAAVLPGKEHSVDEQKIWEQIDALRTIVGYRTTPHRSSIEEVKALYIFTGVEPPSSFEHSADLAELNNKLRFLMSIVGVK